MGRLRWLGGLALMGLLLSDPRAASRGAAEAMAYWYGSVAPALFPFLALMPLLTCQEAARAYEFLFGRAMTVLFDLPGGAAPAMLVGMVAGAPAGALAARRVAAHSGMNRGQLHRLAMSASGFSPAFLVSGVGAGMLGSAALGWRLLASQALAQLTMALLLRRAWLERVQPVEAAAERDEAQPIRAAALSLLTICGYMALFGALSAVAGGWVGERWAKGLLCLLDVPSGARIAAALPIGEEGRVALLAGMCGFGGLCLAAQGLGALKGCGMCPIEYVGIRALAGAICAGYAATLSRLASHVGGGFAAPALRNPYAVGALFAAILAVPVLFSLKKSIS